MKKRITLMEAFELLNSKRKLTEATEEDVVELRFEDFDSAQFDPEWFIDQIEMDREIFDDEVTKRYSNYSPEDLKIVKVFVNKELFDFAHKNFSNDITAFGFQLACGDYLFSYDDHGYLSIDLCSSYDDLMNKIA